MNFEDKNLWILRGLVFLLSLLFLWLYGRSSLQRDPQVTNGEPPRYLSKGEEDEWSKVKGSAQWKKVVGIDQDRNDVRDDIDKFIDGFSNDERVRAALRYEARGHQKILEEGGYVSGVWERIDLAGACVWHLIPDQAYRLGREMEERYYDTIGRSRAYARFNGAMSGKTFTPRLDSMEACDEIIAKKEK